MLRTARATLLALLAILAAASSARAKPEAEKQEPPRAVIRTVPPEVLPEIARDEPLSGPYKEMVRRIAQRGPADTLGDGLFAAAEEAFRAGAFDEATKRYGEFAQKHVRNLKVNDALERILLIRDGRDFDGVPLGMYARAEAMRGAGRADSAAATLQAALHRYPGAYVRWHLRYALAEVARDKGNHDLAVEHALAVADTSARSRLAPYALKLAGDETLASGKPPERAAGYYQSLLERYPDSPLAPSVRARLLLLRKRMQL